MTQSKHTFIISSALNATRSVFSPEKRLAQTFETVASIRREVPNSNLILIDSTLPGGDNEDTVSRSLRDYGVSVIKIVNPVLTQLAESRQNSPAEALSICIGLEAIRSNPEALNVVNQSTRIFKISGRYRLSEDFDIGAYDNLDFVGKYVFKNRLPSWMDERRQYNTGADHLLITRLWSMCPSLLIDYIDRLQLIFDACIQFGIDLEHATYKHIDRSRLVEIPRLFVEGELAINGEHVDD